MNFADISLVSKLSKREQKLLLSQCSIKELQAADVIGSPTIPGEVVYFLSSASVAQLVPRGEKQDVAVGLIASGGSVGLQFALGAGPSQFTLLVQSRGTAWAIEGEAFRRILDDHPAVLLAVARQMWIDAQELARFAMALHSHSVPQRLAQWIRLSCPDDCGVEMDLTHVHMARMLGVRRASVSEAAAELRKLGLVDYNRGRVRVLDAAALTAFCSA